MSCFVCCFICTNECGVQDRNSEVRKAFVGRSSSCLYNALLAPFALLWHALYTYLFSCIWVYTARALNHTFCFLCINFSLFSQCYEYVDETFPSPDEQQRWSEQGIEMIRLSELCVNPKLFQSRTSPEDVAQGTQGSGWLMSPLACMAEFPGLVSSTFITRERSTRGDYSVQLYDASQKRWRVITVDDRVPCRDGQPIFSQPLKEEIWVAILEKALAKMRGSYESISKGNPLWTFRALTGDNVFRLSMKHEENSRNWRERNWEKIDLIDKKPSDTPCFDLNPREQYYKNPDVFELLRAYDNKKSLLCASILPSNEDDSHGRDLEVDEATNLVKGHAYAILEAKRVGKGLLGAVAGSDEPEFDMVKLRNPWKEYEWKGFWSDGDKKWLEHPLVREALQPNGTKTDGTFWMEWSDFCQQFNCIDFCDRTVDYTDLQLDVYESDDPIIHIAGPAAGCVMGCAKYWCLCDGVKTIYFGNDTSLAIDEITDRGGNDDGLV